MRDMLGCRSLRDMLRCMRDMLRCLKDMLRRLRIILPHLWDMSPHLLRCVSRSFQKFGARGLRRHLRMYSLDCFSIFSKFKTKCLSKQLRMSFLTFYSNIIQTSWAVWAVSLNILPKKRHNTISLSFFCSFHHLFLVKKCFHHFWKATGPARCLRDMLRCLGDMLMVRCLRITENNVVFF